MDALSLLSDVGLVGLPDDFLIASIVYFSYIILSSAVVKNGFRI
jgi:hypothetical protein